MYVTVEWVKEDLFSVIPVGAVMIDSPCSLTVGAIVRAKFNGRKKLHPAKIVELSNVYYKYCLYVM